MFDELIEKLKQEKIVYPANQYDKAWNDAVDYIISEYLECRPLTSAVPDAVPVRARIRRVIRPAILIDADDLPRR